MGSDTNSTDADGPVTHMACGFFDFHNASAWPLLDSLAPVITLDLSGRDATLRTLIELLAGELRQQAQGYYVAINQLSYLLFIQILRQQIATGHIETGLLAAMFDPRIGRALAAIHNQPGENWTLSSLSSEARMGRSGFAKRFHELAGIPPMQYLMNWRMQEAQQLLKDKQLSITEIAERCGYESEAAFRKAFKKVTGETPGEARKLATS